jgi:tetratricopeptide (TPR) repeat protein
MNRCRVSRFAATTLYVCLSFAAGSVSAQRTNVPWVGETLDGRSCTGSPSVDYGPYDYRVHKDLLWRVENRHFTPQVEQLIRGDTSRHPMGDVRYTLNSFPNHHRALYSAVRFSLGESSYGSLRQYPAECFLQRAVHFTPNDPVPYMLHGLYLHRLGHLNQSLEKYEAAEALAPTDANLLYNMGLLHFDLRDYAKSYQYAVEAYGYGIEFPGLRRKLQDAGHWE